MYGLKLEASVSYPGICVGLSRCYPGSISDLTIFEDNGEFGKIIVTCGLFLLTKATKDHKVLYELSIQRKNQSEEILQLKTLNVTSEYRLIVSLLKPTLDVISRLTFALTNFHVSRMSLRASDGEFYKSALAKYYSQGEYSVNIRTTTQANYRKRRAARLRTERLVQARTGQRPTQCYNIRHNILSSSFVHDSQYS
uniref:AlNc14C60G4437 protein n=1 Tax=Albugo laibachii Nc14 TaxID=890382 RepID=F0WCQ6_9STRA|nr:AlNc14C60G4437 [Albugo laibachii Nc14]|eukprot:CCA18977.1 AlNc14C60G4437 [Albugo laibachii Nc14]